MNIEYGLPCPILSTQATVSQPSNDGGIADTLIPSFLQIGMEA